MNTDFDIDAFYREQDRRMNLPDEDINKYLARMGTIRKSVLPTLAQLFSPMHVEATTPAEYVTDRHIEEPERTNQTQARVPHTSVKSADNTIRKAKMSSRVAQHHSPLANCISRPSQSISVDKEHHEAASKVAHLLEPSLHHGVSSIYQE